MSDGIKNGPGLSVSQIRDLFFPVGIKVTSRVSPASLVGGTWELLEEGRTIVAASDPGAAEQKYLAGSVGGETGVVLTILNMPKHHHTFPDGTVMNNAPLWKYGPNTGNSHVGDTNQWTSETEQVGGNQPHNNMPPYAAEYIWTRVA